MLTFFRMWVLLGLFGVLGATASAQGIAVQLDGRTLYFDQPPAMIEGRLLVPLRGIFEALTADVVYDAATRSIKATKGATVVQLQLGSRTALIDGRTVYLDVPADTVGGRTMVPLRFVSEALGAEVKWSGATKTVMIASGSGQQVAPPATSPQTSPGGPRIDRVVHNGTSALKVGDAIEVVLTGDPGGQASFEIMGHTQEIALPEVSSGRYQTRYVIPNGLQVQKGVVLGHLKKNGRETALESEREITVRGGNANAAPTSRWQTNPSNNQTVNSLRPPLTVVFPEAVQNGTVRLYVDGLDFTQQARLSGNQLTWQPQYDLAVGRHQAQVRASANSGRTLDHQWAFSIDPNSGASGAFTLQSMLPAQGTVVGARPAISATFNQSLKSVTLTVDGLNVTSMQGIQRTNNSISWTPNYDLQNGNHQASVTAVDTMDRQLSRSWNFTVNSNSNNANTTPNPGLSQVLTVSNLSNGATLPPVFNVQGSAQPGRQVNVVVEYSPNNILEVIAGQSRQMNQSVLVGANGRFDLQFDASAIRSGQTFRVTVTDGGNSPAQVFQVRRQ